MNFDQELRAWRNRKRATRIRRYRERMDQQVRETDPAAWLCAVDRDDAGDDRASTRQTSPLEAR